MSLSKPVMKHPRTSKSPNPTTLQQSESLNPSFLGTEEVEKNRRIASPQVSSAVTSVNPRTKHPRGHKVNILSDTWKVMDAQDFLRLTDTVTLGDVWVQPLSVVSAKGGYGTIAFKQIVDAPHIKWRDTTCKLSLEDLTKMLYLNDCIQWDIQNVERLSFDDWLKEKSSICVKAKGMDEGSDRGKLCNFILTEDREFTFYPVCLHQCCGIFFRKITYHSYKNMDEIKLENPSMIKCKGAKGTFEYIIEARIFPLPNLWFDKAAPTSASMIDCNPPDDDGDTLNLPESQIP